MTDDVLLRELQRIEERLGERVGCLERKLDEVRAEDLPAIREDVAAFKAEMKTEMRLKVWVWGLVGGAIPGAAGLLFLLLRARL